MMKVIFFGAGYCTKYIIPLLPSSAEIKCTHHKKVKKQEFDENFKISRICLSNINKDSDNFFRGTTHILNSIPPSTSGDLIIQRFKPDLIKTLDSIIWYGFLSSTSVYGNHDGKWVDENSETKPSSTRGKLRLLAEFQHLKLFKNYKLPTHIFRLPGIYGPGRSPFDKFKNGQSFKIIKKGHFFSRIFVEDISHALIKSMNNPTPGEIFNLTDDLPAESEKIISFAANLCKISKIKEIKFDDVEVNEKVRSFYFDNKKVSNKKIKKILNWTPKFRNYKLGLKYLFKSINDEENFTNPPFSE